MAGPLEDVLVLDLTQNLPGPFCTLLLADLGATVVKIEPPGGDPMRAFPPQVGGASAGHATVNRNKLSVVLDLKLAAGAAALRRMAAAADVMVEGFRPGTLERLGLDPAELTAANPRLVVCRITGYGQDGPYATRAGHDLNYLAYAGVLGLMGRVADDRPVVPAVQIADLAAGGLMAAVGILAGLAGRERTGRGTVVDASMTDGAASLLGIHLAAALAECRQERGRGPLSGGAAWYDVYRCADGRFVALGAVEPKFFARTCELLGAPDLADRQFDPAAQDDLRERLAARFATRTRDEWAAVLSAEETCVAPVLTPEEAAADPQLAHRGVIIDVPLPGGGVARVPGTPLRLAGYDRPPPAAPPEMGADADAALPRFGFTPAEIADLRDSGAIGATE